MHLTHITSLTEGDSIKISGHIEAEIINNEGVDQIILDGRPVMVYEYRPTPSSVPKLVIRYGNLVFTVGKPGSGSSEGHKSTSSISSPVPVSNGASSGSSANGSDIRLNEYRRSAQLQQERLIEKVKGQISEERHRLDAMERHLIEQINASFRGIFEQTKTAETWVEMLENAKQSGQSFENDEWSINKEQRAKYKAVFDGNCSERYMEGGQVRGILTVSNLPLPLLAQIWALAAVRKANNLNVAEFCMAMHLVTKAIAGSNLPKTVPLALLVSSGIEASD